MSSNELLPELRQRGVEHLGQVKLGLVETEGNISLFFYDEEDLRPGLSVLTVKHREEFKKSPAYGLYCCVNCDSDNLLIKTEKRFAHGVIMTFGQRL
ncbi:hypothetical protein [Pseudomonas fluorescens]|uniref:hypothetical protein n=1 Tax=Pseudomonas fluorescens TaxID=294 RepID=UPI0021E51DB9|nr:hypothetical protein [Pseudomonas fluorescens]